MIVLFMFLSFEKGVSYFEKKLFTRAKKEFANFVTSSKDDPRVPLSLYYLARLSRTPEQALKYLSEIVSGYTGSKYNDDAMLYMEKIYYSTGRYSKAIEVYKKIRKYHPSSIYTDEAIFWAILSYKKTRQMDKAAVLLREIRTRYPASRWTALLKKEKISSTSTSTSSTQSYQYTVQVGAFSKKENAEKLIAELKSKNISAFIVYSNKYYKVRTGKFKTYTEAKNYLKVIKEKGYSATIVKL